MHDGRVLRLGLLSLLLTLVPATAGAADEPEPDTTPPRIVFTPCYAPVQPNACQAYEARDYDQGFVDEDLAVVGARLGDQVLDEYVYNDGSGPAPYGWFGEGDVIFPVNWAIRFVVPSGTHPVTFYARDLSGNSTEQIFHLKGATLPGPPRPAAVSRQPGQLTVFGALDADAHGGTITDAQVQKRGSEVVRRLSFRVPSCRCETTYRKLRPGSHTFRVRARNEIGWSRWVTVRGVVPPRHSYS